MSTPELLSLVLHLRPEGPAPDRPLPRWWGRAAHALLLRLVQQADPALAKRLHDDPAAPRPFTVSNLLGTFPQGRFHPQKPYRLRFTSLEPTFTALLLEATAPGGPLAPGATLVLLGHRFRVLPPPPAEDPWQGQTTYAELLTQAETMAARRLTLRFAAPTAFKTQGHHLPFPLPGLVFGSLAQRWAALAPQPLPGPLEPDWVARLAVSRFRLQSAVVPLKGAARRIGAVGVVTYAALDLSEPARLAWSTLAAWAFYAGVGVSTTQGLGQCRLVAEEDAYGHRPSGSTGRQSLAS